MLRFIYILSGLFLCLITIKSQNKVEIEGSVFLDRNTPASYANVLLLNNDSSFISGSITDEQGLFHLETEKAGTFLLKISYLGYNDVFQNIKTEAGIITLGKFFLESSNINLTGVTVNAKRAIATMKNGNTLINVSNTLLNSLGTAQDVLKHVPGVVYADDELKVIGKGNPVIYIDNHKVLDLTVLERLSSSDIKSIELITMPSAKYDAENRAVLKIITNKKNNNGFSLYSLSRLREGYFLNNMETVNMNYTKNGFNIFCDYTHSYYKTKHTEYTEQTNIGMDTVSLQNSYKPNTEKSNWHIINAGFNYNLNATNSFGMRYTYARSPFHWNLYDGETMIYVNDKLYSSLQKDNYTDATNIHHYINAFYHVDFNPHFKMQIDADYMKIRHKAHSYVIEQSETDSSIVDIYRLRDNYLAAGKLNFDYDLQSAGKLNFGMDYSHIGANGSFQNPQNIVNSNDFLNIENKYSLFASYAFTLVKAQIEVGLRYENLKATNYEQNKVIANKSYSDLFPFISIKYPYKSIQLGINFAERVKRPFLSDLSNDVSYYDKYTYWSGNQLLLPQKIYDIDFFMGYRFLQFKLNYQYIKDYIMDNKSTLPSSVLVTVTKPANFPDYQLLGATIILEKDWGRWKGELTGSIYKPFLTVPGLNGIFHYNKPYGTVICNNTFTFPLDIVANLDMAYYSGGSMDNENYKPKGKIDIGIRKSFDKKGVTISLQGTDLFKWMNSRRYGGINNIQYFVKSIRDSRSISLTLTWKFNNYKKSYNGKSAAEDEAGRL